MKAKLLMKPRLVLVLGCQRSGTTYLAAALGRHPEINMLLEDLGDAVLRGFGKKYNGNKLLIYRQIRATQRATKFGHLINRLLNLGKAFKKRNYYPVSKLSVQDYMDLGAMVIVIFRKKDDVIKSMITRSGYTRKEAQKEYARSMKELSKLVWDVNIHYEILVKNETETLKMICARLGLEYDNRMINPENLRK